MQWLSDTKPKTNLCFHIIQYVIYLYWCTVLCTTVCAMMFLFTLLLQAHGMADDEKRKKNKINTFAMNVKLIIIKNVTKARVIYLLSWFIAYCIQWIDDWMAKWLDGWMVGWCVSVCIYVCIVCAAFVAWSNFEW